jgi:hypothetical protein
MLIYKFYRSTLVDLIWQIPILFFLFQRWRLRSPASIITECETNMFQRWRLTSPASIITECETNMGAEFFNVNWYSVQMKLYAFVLLINAHVPLLLLRQHSVNHPMHWLIDLSSGQEAGTHVRRLTAFRRLSVPRSIITVRATSTHRHKCFVQGSG